MQPPADRGVDPDGPATDAASTPTDGWTPPPWTAGPDAPDRLDAATMDAGCRRHPALLATDPGRLVDRRRARAAGGRRRRLRTSTASRSATGEPEVAPAEPTQVLSGLPHDHKRRVDLRVGDCFDLKDPTADQIEDVKAVPCTTEHEFELFYVGAMGKGSHPTDLTEGNSISRTRSGRTWTRTATPRSVPISARRTTIPTSTIYWLVPTAMPGGRAIGPCSAPPTIRDLSPDRVAPGHPAVALPSDLVRRRAGQRANPQHGQGSRATSQIVARPNDPKPRLGPSRCEGLLGLAAGRPASVN